MIVLGFGIGAALFMAAAILGERHALWIPALLLVAAAAANALLP